MDPYEQFFNAQAANALIGNQPTGNKQELDPMLMGGLGLGGGFVASQTGGAPATSQVLSSFAQKVAARDASRMAAQNLPQLIGGPQSYQGVPTTSTPAQFTGTNAGRLTPGTNIVPQTQLVPTNQPPAVQTSGSLSTTAKPGVKPTASSYGYSVNTNAAPQAKPSVLKNVASGLLKGGVITALATPNTMGDATIMGAFNRRVAAGEDANQVRIDLGLDTSDTSGYGALVEPTVQSDAQPTVESIILGKQARGPDATFTPEELAKITSIQGSDQAADKQFVEDYQGTQMDIAKSLQAMGNVDDLRGVEAELAARGINRDLTTPFLETAESLGEANASSSFTPRSTFISNGKYIQEDEFGQRRELTPEQYNAFQSNMAELGQPTQTPRPMGRDETRARLGGRTLSEYLNAPNGTEGVSGLRTDAQGRMIPGGYQTREQAYPEYEAAAAEREQRAAYDWANRGSQRGGSGGGAPREGSEFFDPVASQNIPRDVRTALNTPVQQRSGDQQQRLSQWEVSTQGKEMGGIAGYEESSKSPQQKQEDELQNRYTQARLSEFEKQDPSAYETAQSTVDDFIANGGGDKGKRSQYIAQILGLAPKGKGKKPVDSFISGGIDSDLPTVLTEADFAKLKSGDRYIDSQGNRATKP